MFLRTERTLLKVVLEMSVLFVALVSSVVLAQVNTADLHGTITDPSGAVIADAEIKIQTLDTGLVRTDRTNDNGNYDFLALAPGRYSLQVAATGFPTHCGQGDYP